MTRKRIIGRYALYFDGATSYVDLGNVLNMGTNSFSIVCRVKSLETGTTKGIVGKKESFATIVAKGYALGQSITGTKWGFRVGDGTNGASADGAPIITGVEVWLAGTFDETKTARLYVNGALSASNQNTNIGSIDTSASFRIGRIDTYWKGFASDLLVYKGRALSQTEIQQIMSGLVPTQNLVLWARFDEGRGTVLHDYSGYNNHGTIYRARWVRAPRKVIRFG